MKHNGYDNISLPYSPTLEQAQDKIEKEIRKSKIIWFNPTFCMSVKRNVDNTFFKFLQRHFPKRHLVHKIFNRKTVKISYCCMWKMKSIILSNNKQILIPSKEYFGCNSKVTNECPLNKGHLFVYEAKISNEFKSECKIYCGASEAPFKERFRNHTRGFKHVCTEQKCIELSKCIWKLKSHGICLYVYE